MLNIQAAAGGKAAANFLPDPLESGLSTLVQQRIAGATADNRQQQQHLEPPQQQEGGEADIADVLLQASESDEAAAVVDVVQQKQQVPRLNAVLIDSAKDGEDGGELMRRAVRNLPGVLRGQGLGWGQEPASMLVAAQRRAWASNMGNLL